MAKKNEKRQQAFEKPPTGQAVPGALSNVSAQGPNKSVMPSLPSNYVTLPSGKTGTVVQAPQYSPEDIAKSIGSQTEGVKAKIAAEAAKPAVGFLGTQMTAQAPNPVQQIMPNPNAATNAAPQPKTQDYGTNWTETTKKAIKEAYFNWGDTLAKNPDGSFNLETVSSRVILLPSAVSGRAILGLGKAATKSSVGTKATTLIRNFFYKDVLTRVAGGKWNTTSKLNWVAITGTIATLAYIAKETLGGRNQGNFLGSEEASQTPITAKLMAERYGTFKDRQEARDLVKEALDFDAGKIPFLNVAAGLEKYQDIARRAIAIEERIDADREAGLPEEATKEETAAFWFDYNVRIQDMKLEKARLAEEQYNASKLLGEQQLLKARAAYQDAERAADRKAAQETAAFWLDYQRELARIKEEERIKEAEFWALYKKMTVSAQAQGSSSWDYGKSGLGFGLMR